MDKFQRTGAANPYRDAIHLERAFDIVHARPVTGREGRDLVAYAGEARTFRHSAAPRLDTLTLCMGAKLPQCSK
ncbi:hypothetical protein [Mesorhizobium sp. WSM2239]|uniref:Uncharacterized protein n=2 Tax=unclassified Mesorhizobium TaxID=325217 RepID=A0AAU8DCH7_9HYPH